MLPRVSGQVLAAASVVRRNQSVYWLVGCLLGVPAKGVGGGGVGRGVSRTGVLRQVRMLSHYIMLIIIIIIIVMIDNSVFLERLST